MPFVDSNCITHHYACDCREHKFKMIQIQNAALIECLKDVTPRLTGQDYMDAKLILKSVEDSEVNL